MMESSAEKASALLRDVKELRQRARVHMARGDRKTVQDLLNTSLATKLVCMLWYRRHYFTATGIQDQIAAAEFLEHATEEQIHADRIADRIAELGGAPDFNPKGLETRSQKGHLGGSDLVDLICEDLVAEQITIESHGEIIRYLGENDPTTRRMLEEILAVEEGHAEGLHALIHRTS